MDVHQHYCRQCRRPWKHDSDELQDNVAIKAAHRCPSCGTPGWVKFYGNETHDEMCEMEALVELSEDERVPEHVRLQAEDDFAALAQRLHRPNEPAPPGRWRVRKDYEGGKALDELLALLGDL